MKDDVEKNDKVKKPVRPITSFNWLLRT